MASFKPREVIRILEKLGYVNKRQTGSHVMRYHYKTNKLIAVPYHTRELKKGLLRSIIKYADSTEKEFLKLK